MRYLLGFISNALLFMFFWFDLIDYHFNIGTGMTDPNVNRPVIIILGICTTVCSSAYFLHKFNQYQNGRK